MQYDQSFYKGIWSKILKKYNPSQPITDLGDLSRASILETILEQFVSSKCKFVIHDYGAGNWLYLPTILEVCAKIGSERTIHGYDYSREALDYGVRRARVCGIDTSNVYTHDGDLRKMIQEVSDSSVDVVICLEVLEHVEEDCEMVHNFYRILRPGGVCIISVPNRKPFPFSLNFIQYSIMREKFTQKDVRVGHLRRYSVADMTRIVADHNFAVVNLRPYGILLSDYLKMISDVLSRLSRSCFWLVRVENRLAYLLKFTRSEGFFLVCNKK